MGWREAGVSIDRDIGAVVSANGSINIPNIIHLPATLECVLTCITLWPSHYQRSLLHATELQWLRLVPSAPRSAPRQPLLVPTWPFQCEPTRRSLSSKRRQVCVVIRVDVVHLCQGMSNGIILVFRNENGFELHVITVSEGGDEKIRTLRPETYGDFLGRADHRYITSRITAFLPS